MNASLLHTEKQPIIDHVFVYEKYQGEIPVTGSTVESLNASLSARFTEIRKSKSVPVHFSLRSTSIVDPYRTLPDEDRCDVSGAFKPRVKEARLIIHALSTVPVHPGISIADQKSDIVSRSQSMKKRFFFELIEFK